jgi:hypothetical protein
MARRGNAVPSVLMEKTKLLEEMIGKRFHDEYMISEEADEDSVTFQPFTGIVPDNMKDGIAKVSDDNPQEADPNA